MDVVEYPLWRVAMEKVLVLFEDHGHGFTITHDKLMAWMGIEKPTTVERVKRAQLDYLSGIDSLRTELLESANLYLHPVIGQGYKLLHPSEQINKGASYYLNKSKRALRRTAMVLANVDTNLLSTEEKKAHIDSISRIAFLKAAYRRRITSE